MEREYTRRSLRIFENMIGGGLMKMFPTNTQKEENNKEKQKWRNSHGNLSHQLMRELRREWMRTRESLCKH